MWLFVRSSLRPTPPWAFSQPLLPGFFSTECEAVAAESLWMCKPFLVTGVSLLRGRCRRRDAPQGQGAQSPPSLCASAPSGHKGAAEESPRLPVDGGGKAKGLMGSRFLGPPRLLRGRCAVL